MFKDLIYNLSLEESVGTAIIDAGNKVIKNVVLLTGNKVSHNRTKYLESAVQEALTRYEGAKMYVDHASKTDKAERHGVRSVRDLGGVYRNVHRDGDKVIADLHVMESKWPMVQDIANARPAGVGLSISDRGRVREDGGVTLVEGFEPGASCSVDLVSEVSLNKDLFESKDEGGMQMDWSKVTVAELNEHCPDLVKSIKAEATAPIQKDLDEAKAKLEAGEAKAFEASKLALLAEAKMSDEAKSILKKVLVKKETTVEEAKSMIADQIALVTKLEEAFSKKSSDKNPAVKITDGHENLSEAKKEDETLLAPEALADALKR